ncbi:MAG: hypothetical protein ACHQX4_12050 [Gemmatimonadales bacterium]
MLVSSLLVAATIAALAPRSPSAAGPAARDTIPHPARTTVALDSGYREVVITVGPFHVPRAMAMSDEAMMMMMSQQDTVVGTFEFPVSAWFHGAKLEVVDGRGAQLPRRLLHHMNVMNFARRQLVYPIVERSFAFGQETEDMSVPASIGMPLLRGQRLGVVVMWDNETGRDIDDAFVRLTFKLNPRNQYPPPLTVLPFFVDVHMVAGGFDTLSIPPGGRTISCEFTLPLSGHLLAASGHLHEHGRTVRLEEAASGREVVTVEARTDSTGRVIGMSRALLALWTDGKRLEAGRRYRLVVVYDNPTGATLTGMMGMMAGIFAPDNPRAWPRVDVTDRDYLADLANLPSSERRTAAQEAPSPRP